MDRRVFLAQSLALGAATGSLSAQEQSQDQGINGVIIAGNVPGIDPSGETDSSNGFLSLLQMALSEKKSISFGAGTYKFENLNGATAQGSVKIVGAGRDQVHFIGNPSKTFLSFSHQSGLSIKGINFKNFKFVFRYDQVELNDISICDCSFTHIGRQIIGTGDGVRLNKLESFSFVGNICEKIGLENGFSAAVKIDGLKVKNSVVERNLIKSVGSTSKMGNCYGVYLAVGRPNDDKDVKSFVINNDIRDVRMNSLDNCNGIKVLGGQTIIQGNHLEEVISSNSNNEDNEGIYTKCRNSVISSNTLINCGGNEGVIICKGRNRGDADESLGAWGYDNIISHNVIRHHQSIGLQTTGITVTMDGFIVSNNHISGLEQGISVWKGVKNTIVQSNMIIGLVSRLADSVVFGIHAGDLNDCMILDNQIKRLTSSNGKGCYGIYITSSGTIGPGGMIRGNWISHLTGQSPSNSRGIAINLKSNDVIGKLIVESNHMNQCSYGIKSNNHTSSTVKHSAAINNTVSNNTHTAISPGPSGWTRFDN